MRVTSSGLKVVTRKRAKVRIVRRPVHLSAMRRDERNLRLRVTRRQEPDLDKLIEWVLSIAEARHRAWLNGDPDPYGLPPPEGLASVRRCTLRFVRGAREDRHQEAPQQGGPP